MLSPSHCFYDQGLLVGHSRGDVVVTSKLSEGKIALAQFCRDHVSGQLASPGHKSNDQGLTPVIQTQNSPPRAGCALIDKRTASPWWAYRFDNRSRLSEPSESPFSGLSDGRMQVVRAYDHLKAIGTECTSVRSVPSFLCGSTHETSGICRQTWAVRKTEVDCKWPNWKRSQKGQSHLLEKPNPVVFS